MMSADTGFRGATCRAGVAACVLACAAACGSGAAPARVPEPGVARPTVEAGGPLQPGAYRLTLWVPCGAAERTTTGVLTLRPMAESDAGLSSDESEGALLWGRAELDLEPLRSCPGSAPVGAEDPIHPSVLVEVLNWDGKQKHQVLLVATQPGQGQQARIAGGGIALWVEATGRGQLSGVWSRWDVMDQRGGRWQAEPAGEKGSTRDD